MSDCHESSHQGSPRGTQCMAPPAGLFGKPTCANPPLGCSPWLCSFWPRKPLWRMLAASCVHGVSCNLCSIDLPCWFTPGLCTTAALAVTSVMPVFFSAHVIGTSVGQSWQYPTGFPWSHGASGVVKIAGCNTLPASGFFPYKQCTYCSYLWLLKEFLADA